MTNETATVLPDAGTKVCRTCGKEKLLTEFHFQRERPTSGQKRSEAPRLRYRADCKECHREYMRQRRIAKVQEGGVEYLENETKRIRQFYRQNPDRLDLRRATDRARYSALAELKVRHPKEFDELFLYYRRHEGVPDDYPG